MTSVILGATAGLGRALSEELAKRGSDLVLIASDARDLDAFSRHLSLMHGVKVHQVAVDASDHEALVADLKAALMGIKSISALYAPIGVSSDLDRVTSATKLSKTLMDVNFGSVVTTIQTALPALLETKDARIVGFGSIATMRGRNRNMVYASAKNALSSYFQSLRHALAKDQVTVQFYQMGFLKTQQLFGQSSLFPALTPEAAARKILGDGNRDFGERFMPAYWTIIAVILKLLPWRIFRKLQF